MKRKGTPKKWRKTLRIIETTSNEEQKKLALEKFKKMLSSKVLSSIVVRED